MSKKASQPKPRNKSVLNRPPMHTPAQCLRENARSQGRSFGYRPVSGLVAWRPSRLVRTRVLESIQGELTTADRARRFHRLCDVPRPRAVPNTPRHPLSNNQIDLPPDLPPCRPPRLTNANGSGVGRRPVDRLFDKQAVRHRRTGISWI